MPLQNDIQNISSEFNSFVYKMSHVKKEMICIWRGIYLYAKTLSMTLRFLFLAFFSVHSIPGHSLKKKLHAKHFSCLVVLYSSLSNTTCFYSIMLVTLIHWSMHKQLICLYICTYFHLQTCIFNASISSQINSLDLNIYS